MKKAGLAEHSVSDFTYCFVLHLSIFSSTARSECISLFHCGEEMQFCHSYSFALMYKYCVFSRTRKGEKKSEFKRKAAAETHLCG